MTLDMIAGAVMAAAQQLDRDEEPREYRPIGASRVTLYVVSTIVLSLIAVVFVVVITLIRPEADNTALITLVIGVLTPSVGALLAGALKEVHTDVNSRLTEFLALTAKASKAEGELKGQREPIPVAAVGVVEPIVSTLEPLASKLEDIAKHTKKTADNTAVLKKKETP